MHFTRIHDSIAISESKLRTMTPYPALAIILTVSIDWIVNTRSFSGRETAARREIGERRERTTEMFWQLNICWFVNADCWSNHPALLTLCMLIFLIQISNWRVQCISMPKSTKVFYCIWKIEIKRNLSAWITDGWNRFHVLCSAIYDLEDFCWVGSWTNLIFDWGKGLWNDFLLLLIHCKLWSFNIPWTKKWRTLDWTVTSAA